MASTEIVIKGAREHNLRSVDLVIPRNQLVCLTGVSGSGKSSLAFDTLYAEGQRRYIESLSSFARQFLGQMPKPDVDYVSGLSPSISISQKTAGKNPRSTVGTITEIYDYLRVLYARIGQGNCPSCGQKIQAQSREEIVGRILQIPTGSSIHVLAPLIRGQKGHYRDLFEDLLKQGFVRARVDGEIVNLADDIQLDRRLRHTIEVVIDRLVLADNLRSRLAEAVELALKIGQGAVVIGRGDEAGAPPPAPRPPRAPQVKLAEEPDDLAEDDDLSEEEDLSEEGEGPPPAGSPHDLRLSAHYACAACDLSFEPPSPQLFSFNSPHGMCLTCDGLGEVFTFDPDLVVTHPDRSVRGGCMELLGKWKDLNRWRHCVLEGVAETIERVRELPAGTMLNTPWRELPAELQQLWLWGTDQQHITFTWRSGSSPIKYGGRFEGFLPELTQKYRAAKGKIQRLKLEKLMRTLPCHVCQGERLNPQARAVTLSSIPSYATSQPATPIPLTLPQLGDLTILQAHDFVQQLQLDATQTLIAGELLKEIRNRLGFLLDVGLDYLTLNRRAPTLSGGEAQRIRLAGQVGCALVGVLYILDEPSIGLHPRDNQRLLETLEKLRDLGNTVLVVEHDEDTMRAADHVIDFGPGAGVRGGEVVAQGTVAEICRSPRSVTGQFLSGKEQIPTPQQRRPPGDAWLKVVNVNHHNLRNVSTEIPLGRFVCVTGVSGSGKSSLVNDIISAALHKELNFGEAEPGSYERLEGLQHLDKLIAIDQSPIGRTPRSNPGTYVKIFDEIRKLFTMLPDAKRKGFSPGRFSFNVRGGRCEACEGNGATKLDMDFLADIWVTCPVCEGKRFSRETLSVLFKDKSISDVLDMDVGEAMKLFENVPKIYERLKTLHDVGMDYVKIGQPSPTLSGGEAQRIKLARELTKRSTGRTLYLLDEPTTGLHFADVRLLLKVLHDFVDAGNTVLVVEHNLDVIKTADWLIDLGPEGGARGGRILVAGPPEDVARCEESYTGQSLAPILGLPRQGRLAVPTAAKTARQGRDDQLVVRGARQHNLRDVNVTLPRDQMTVFCGPSGSGKSSLAMDTIYAEGQRRYVESLSSYARQFVGQMQKPELESIDGLSPAIAIEQQNLGNSPRSTVGTVTEIYDYLRVLMARLGTPHCPGCQIPIGTQTVDQICDKVLRHDEGTRLYLLAPMELEMGATYEELWVQLQTQGYVRIRVNGVTYPLDNPPALDRRRKQDVEVLVDRIVVKANQRSRIAESLEAALAIGKGVVRIAVPDDALPEASWRVTSYSQHLACEQCGRSFEPLTPHHFSFNSPLGWCPGCEGLGKQTGTDLAALLKSDMTSLQDGVLLLWPALQSSMSSRMLQALGSALAIPLDVAWNQLDVRQRRLLLYGTGERWIEVPAIEADDTEGAPQPAFRFQFKGIYPSLEDAARLSPRLRMRLSGLVGEVECSMCLGSRTRDDAGSVRFRERTLDQYCHMPLGQLLTTISQWKLNAREKKIAGELLREIAGRVQFLNDVGLEYITLARTAGTLSGGEAQRIRLASQLGSGLCGVLYVLDEPTIGLHPRDNRRLLAALHKLRDLGNTLILVEHDREIIEGTDQLVDFGPGAGKHGGQIVAQAIPDQLGRQKGSVTGPYLTGQKAMLVPTNRRKPTHWMRLVGAQHHNLKNVTAEFPLGTLTAVTGPSGSGKSSLVYDTLAAALTRRLNRTVAAPGIFQSLEGMEHLDKVVQVDQQPLGNSPSSNPATYTGAMEWIRELFAQLPEARQRGYTARRFSFNVPGGRCEACEGQGQRRIEMHFLADVWIPCDVCDGQRYDKETLEIRYHGKSIADVLAMSCGDARQLFDSIPPLQRVLQTLCDVGLDYLALGQSAPTLSGGEAQRVKLARELGRPDTGRTVYLLDEPTTGLHFSDLEKLLDVLHRLVDLGNTVIVVEHNLEVIKSADWVIDIGPEASEQGGQIVVAGTPESVVAHALRAAPGSKRRGKSAPLLRSYTGEALAPVLEAGPHGSRPAWRDRIEPADDKATKLALAEVAGQALTPWEADGRTWHLATRVGRDGKPCQWDSRVLQAVIDEIERRPAFAIHWAHRSVVEVTGPVKSHGWFLHGITAETWVLKLKFRVRRNTFKATELQELFGLKPWNQIPDLPIYGNEPRVTCTNIGGNWQEVQILAHGWDELAPNAISQFMQRAAESFLRRVDFDESLPVDATSPLQEEKRGRTWHFTRLGFPEGAKVRWDIAILKDLFTRLRSVAGLAEVEWNHDQAVHLFVREQPTAWATLYTKRPDSLDLRLVGPKGKFAPDVVAKLAPETRIEHDKDYDVIEFHFTETAEIREPHLLKFLLDHRLSVQKQSVPKKT